ncbi:outer membrane beta-barrel protein [Oscillatoria sp. CS-180]|uniref:outer membrane beta-barrel protein n=1 Tax=Oscillatoria sp. CS-180 TaxID=3021720 RepID=UPI00232FDB3D|nr:outer membrane beta-barrel protein [Oscillatoria sp. CS-180]MDB9526066.1 outer membrane beta-barrel protein [Oscillatoria sp. CS-180]
MALFQRISLLTSGAVAILIAVPAQAEEALTQVDIAADMPDVLAVSLEAKASETTLEVNPSKDAEAIAVAELESDVTAEENVLSEKVATQEETTRQTLGEFLAESDEVISNESVEAVPVEQVAVVSEPVATSADSFFSETIPAEVPEVTTESREVAQEDSQEVAQVTRPLYRGVSPFYVGIGGNIGIIDSDKSAVGDFGFNVISKVSLGPRFSVRPTLQFSEDHFNVTLPVTYNFNPLEVRDFSIYPFLGGGIDIGDDVGLLVNGGVDIPISRQFTLNSQVNWRVSEETGLGVSLGVGYNFPVFFE